MATQLILVTDDHPNSRTRTKHVLGEEFTDRAGSTKVRCLSDCKVGDLLDYQYVAAVTKKPYITGWHGPNSAPDKCQHAFVSPRGVVNLCGHESHAGQETDPRSVDERRRCRNCSDYLEPKRVGRGFSPGPICVDSKACAERERALLAATPKLAEIRARKVISEERLGEVGDAVMGHWQSPPKRSAKSPKECKCGCKGMTKGGTFLPGHDARYHAAQKKAGK